MIKTAIIVPFRDSDNSGVRTNQLIQFIKYMNTFLEGYNYKIFIIEQSQDNLLFNRGQLLNIGFKYAVHLGYNIFIFHDVDLLPSNELKKYYINIPKIPTHLASVWDRYNSNSKYFGGITAFSKEQFYKINGFPNFIFGWSAEDDILYNRTIQFFKIKKVNEGHITDLENLNIKQKLNFLKENNLKFKLKWEAIETDKYNWKKDGLSNICNIGIKEIQLNNSTNIFRVIVQLGKI